VKIANAHDDDSLSASWFQFNQRLRLALNRAGYIGQIDLVRLSDVARDVDVLVVAPDLFEMARSSVGDAVHVVALAPKDAKALSAFVAQIVADAGAEIVPEDAVAVVRHRGFQLVATRFVVDLLPDVTSSAKPDSLPKSKPPDGEGG
jgi:hypothetical protein